MAKIIIQGKANEIIGQTFPYTPDDDAPAIFSLSGSAFSNSDDQIIGYTVYANDQEITSTQLYSQDRMIHRALVPGMAKYTMPFELKFTLNAEGLREYDADGSMHAEEVTITIKHMTDDTRSDKNDFIVFTRL